MDVSFFSTLSLNVLVPALIFIGGFFYALVRGKEKIISAILAFYPSLFFMSIFPYWNAAVFEKEGIHSFVAHLGVFLLFYIPIHLILSRVVESYYSEKRSGKFLQIASLSLAFAVLVMALLINFLPVIFVFSISSLITKYLFWFLIAPFLLILIAIKE